MVASPGGLAAVASVESHRSTPTAPPEAPRLVLEITRGRTRFRRRPVTGSRFLIGGGVTCDLRLGGEHVPVLHSLITIHEGEVHIEAIAPKPGLLVNGRGVREAKLSDGDVIGIGDIELLARLSARHAPAGAQSAHSVARPVERPLTEMSAVELIDQIELEERQIDEFENRRGTGARALLEAVQRRSAGTPASGVAAPASRHAIPAPHFLSKRPQVLAARGRKSQGEAGPTEQGANPEFVNELELLGRQLTALSQELQSNSERASVRESQYAAATDLLMETQHKLASQLEALVSRVGIVQQQAVPTKPRAIA
jgi:pSer/pThr/pTyr-binding forkhead associated (FHA) protein